MARPQDQAREKPIIVHPGPASIEDLLKLIDPAPEEEAEAFVEMIYAARRESATSTIFRTCRF
jgi:hypothetical protein